MISKAVSFAASLVLPLQSPMLAACINADCTAFSPGSTTTFSRPLPLATYTPDPPLVFNAVAGASFVDVAIANNTGTWLTSPSFSIAGISLSGGNINGQLLFNNAQFSGTGTVRSFLSSSNTGSLDPNSVSGASLNFTIPAGVATPGATLYINAFLGQPPNQQLATNAPGEVWSFTLTAQTPPATPPPVPGPAPIMGLGIAFGFSRSLRHRIKSAKKNDT